MVVVAIAGGATDHSPKQASNEDSEQIGERKLSNTWHHLY